MHIRFNLQSQTKRYPLSYRFMVVSIIKEALKTMDEAYFHELYSGEKQVPKPYTSAVHLQKFTMLTDELEAEEFSVNISSGDYKFMIHLLGGLQKLDECIYQQYKLKLTRLHMPQSPRVTSEAVILKTLSPILLENEQGKPMAPDDAGYVERLNDVMDKLKATITGTPLLRPFHISALSFKKTVTKERNSHFDHHYKDISKDSVKRYLYYTAYHGRFLLQGEVEDLQWLVDYGIGQRRSQSYGMVAIESEVN